MAELTPNRLTHLKQLEAESIHIIREVAAEFENPVMLYSIGKDSSVMVRLAHQGVPSGAAAVPAPAHRHDLEVPRDDRVPRSLLPKRTGSSSSSTRTRTGCARASTRSITASEKYTHRHEDAGAAAGAHARTASTRPSAARAATRRSRAPRSASTRFRDRYQQWDPKNQRPELWNLYNAKVNEGREHPRLSRCRTGPSSTSGSTSTWRTSRSCRCTSPSRGRWSSATARSSWSTTSACACARARSRRSGRSASARSAAIRCRARSRSSATTLPEIIHEMLLTRQSERQGRLIDHDEDASMETKKREGYF